MVSRINSNKNNHFTVVVMLENLEIDARIK